MAWMAVPCRLRHGGKSFLCFCVFVCLLSTSLFTQAASCPRGLICLKSVEGISRLCGSEILQFASALAASGSDSGCSPSRTTPTSPLPLPPPPDLVHPQTHLVFRCSHAVRRAAPLLIGCPGRPPAEAFYLSPLFFLFCFFKGSCAPSMKIHSRIGGEGRKTGFSQS